MVEATTWFLRLDYLLMDTSGLGASTSDGLLLDYQAGEVTCRHSGDSPSRAQPPCPLGQHSRHAAKLSWILHISPSASWTSLWTSINAVPCHAKLHLTLCDLMDCSLPVSSVDGILWEGRLEWVAVPYSRGSFLSKDWAHISCGSCFVSRFLTSVSPGKPLSMLCGTKNIT